MQSLWCRLRAFQDILLQGTLEDRNAEKQRLEGIKMITAYMEFESWRNLDFVSGSKVNEEDLVIKVPVSILRIKESHKKSELEILLKTLFKVEDSLESLEERLKVIKDCYKSSFEAVYTGKWVCFMSSPYQIELMNAYSCSIRGAFNKLVKKMEPISSFIEATEEDAELLHKKDEEKD